MAFFNAVRNNYLYASVYVLSMFFKSSITSQFNFIISVICRSDQVWQTLSKDHAVLAATHAFIHKWNEPYLPLPSQPKLAII